MATATNNAPANGRASTLKTTFSRETAVRISIQADPAIIWALLTRASDYPRWNSTVISIEGTIASGETVKLKSKLDPKRIFKLRVKQFEPEKQLAWGDGTGTRTYTLTKNGGAVIFTMHEKIGGFLFPLFTGMIPSFDESFNQFAADLKKEAETIMNSK